MEKPLLRREALGVLGQGKSRMNTALVRGISYAEAVKKFKGHDGSVLVEANSSVTIFSQIHQYKSLAEDVNHLSRAFVAKSRRLNEVVHAKVDDNFFDIHVVEEGVEERKKEASGYASSLGSSCNLSDDEMVLEVATRWWEAVEKGLGLDEDKGISAGPAVSLKRHAKSNTINEETSLPKGTMQQHHAYLNGVWANRQTKILNVAHLQALVIPL
ncbi:hypothetical protein VNO78_28856 [Psophocarpus tetragonolobus]|uniref:Uncharacterized protein n=1 Tax=Psophocarpus tetragonolobus TaxID=3891 RepID=A0AAN9RTY0_PSOTE